MEAKESRLATLASGYSDGMRRFDTGVIVGYGVLQTYLLGRVFSNMPPGRWFLVAFGCFLGFLGADFVSGFLHWAADTWGTPEWPIVGGALVRPFREHHLDQKAITKHGFVETNGTTCLAALPFLLIAVFVPLGSDFGLFVVSFLAFQCFWGSPTAQFHKWAHQETVPRWVELLQKSRVILPSEKHVTHHTRPFDRNYCITSGTLNAPLEAIGFFGVLESLIHRMTGAIPREDDLGTEVALRLAEKKLGVGRLDESIR